MHSLRRFAVLALALASCREGRAADPVILALGEQVVRRSDFERHLKALESRGGSAVDSSVREALLEPFLEERVLVLEARNRGMLKLESSAEEEQRVAQGLLAESTEKGAQVTDAEVDAFYHEHADELQSPETVTLHQILVSTTNEARDVRRRLHRDPKVFEILARTVSRGPEAAAGGLMGTFERGQLPPELEQSAFALAPGGISDVVESPLGFHVLRVDARGPSQKLTLQESRERIRARLQRQKSETAAQEYVRGLMARAKVNHEAAKSRPHGS